MVKVCVTTVIIDFEIGTGIQYISNCLVIMIFVLECLCSMTTFLIKDQVS